MSSPLSNSHENSPQNLEIIQHGGGNSDGMVQHPSPNDDLIGNMGNMNVLDLHKSNSSTNHHHQHHSHHNSAEHDHILDGRLIINDDDNNSNSDNSGSITKIELTNEQLYRILDSTNPHHHQLLAKLLAANGSGEIISREIINGEHHILTRNDKGEHIITRIVDPFKFTPPPPTNQPTVLQYTDNRGHIPALHSNSVKSEVDMYHDDSNNNNNNSPLSSVGQSVIETNKMMPSKNIMYTTGSPHDDGTVTTISDANDPDDSSVPINLIEKSNLIYGEPKQEIFDDDKLYEKPQIDLIYEDGKQTVIYTTATAAPGSVSDSGELVDSLNGQVVGIPTATYTTQTGPDGATVVVVQELVEPHHAQSGDDEILSAGHISRYLSQGCSFQKLSWSWKVGKETVRLIIYETCDAIWNVLGRLYVTEPTMNDTTSIANDFMQLWNFPNCIGAIDGKHIAIQCPPGTASQFFNYKKFYSIVLMAACDARYVFTHIDVGAYGSQHDGGIFQKSSFGRRLCSGQLLVPDPKAIPGTGVVIPHFFVADAAFPLTPNIMKPYPGLGLTKTKEIFNKRLSRARRVIENAFGILVCRWRVLMNTLNMQPDNAEKIVLACVALHNFLRLNKQIKHIYTPLNYTDWEDGNHDLHEGLWRQDKNCILPSLRTSRNIHVLGGRHALNIRDDLCKYVNGEGRLDWLN